VAPPCAWSRSSCASTRSGRRHELRSAAVPLRAQFVTVGFRDSVAESGLLLGIAQVARFTALAGRPGDSSDGYGYPFPPVRRTGAPNHDGFFARGQHRIPIGRAPPKPRSSIPRFPPWRFIQRLPA
jgi:hypothetical protein